MARTRQEKLYAVIDAITEYNESKEYGRNYDKFSRVVSNKKEALINYDTEEGAFIRVFNQFRRELINTGVASALSIFNQTSKSLKKGISYDQYAKWNSDLGKKIPQINEHFQNKLIVPITASYGKGFDRGMEDQGFKPKNEWMYLPGHVVPRLTNLRLVNYISKSLNIEMTAVIVEGMRQGQNGNKIARELRKLITKPKSIVVPPKLDADGNVIRKGYSYGMSQKRYSEIIGRTEVNRATNLGRLDSYKQSGLVKSVVFITAGDDRVCPECESLLDTVVPVDQSFTIIPVHVMCRCTWEAYEYYENRDRDEAEEKFKTDEISQALNTAPIGGIADSKFDSASSGYAKHLASRGYTKEKYPEVYSKLKGQLKNLVGVPDIQGFDQKNIDHLYALHRIKNNRLYLSRMGKNKMRPTTYEFVKKSRKKRIPLADTTWSMQQGAIDVHRTRLYYQSVERSVRAFDKTIFHEAAHNIHNSIPTSRNILKEWKVLHTVPRYVTGYAKVDYREDFAESFAYYIIDPAKLKTSSSTKFSYMAKNMFED